MKRSLFALACLAAAACVQAVVDPPQQIHLALAGNDGTGRSNGMAVSWVTNDVTATSLVHWGLSPSALTNVASGSCSTYYATYDHHAVMAPLQPSTRYYYTVGDAAAGVSSVQSFMSAPSSANTSAFTIAVYGDMGIYNSQDTRALLDKFVFGGDVDWVFHVGDISYADDAFLHDPFVFGYESTWNTYMTWMENVTNQVPYMVLPGNHEAECHSPICLLDDNKKMSLANYSAYNHRFRMPFAESGANSNMWYSFNYGPVHFISLDTETDYPGAPINNYTGLPMGGFGNQLAWLRADLIAANASRAERPWIIVGGHRPLYGLTESDANGNPVGTCASIQAAFEALFFEFGVDLYVVGHEHSYERQWPAYKGQATQLNYVNPRATTYLIIGAAGNTEGHTSYAHIYTPSWRATYNGEDYGIGTMTFHNTTHLEWNFFRGTDGAVLDSMWLVKTHH